MAELLHGCMDTWIHGVMGTRGIGRDGLNEIEFVLLDIVLFIF
jgi:hypothetical protein